MPLHSRVGGRSGKVMGRKGNRVLLAGLCLLAAGPAGAGVSTDGTVGPLRDLSGAMIIGEDLGRRVGDNLFHSFRLFNIATGESATFTGAADIANVIGRVTGGSASTIDGLLRSQVGQANFFLINPAGVIFGPNAQVDVPAAFHVSTADRINFPDGYYSATDTAGSTLSIAAPESFGFLARQAPADIRVRGSNLAFKPGKTVSLVGGNVTATIDWGTLRLARISSQGGDVRVIAVGAPDAENRIAVRDGSSTMAPKGRVEIGGASGINVSGPAGPESILLRGGTVDISSFPRSTGYPSWLAALHTGNQDSAGLIRVEADDIRIADSDILASPLGHGRGNSIELEARRSFEADAALLATVTSGAGAAGDIRIRAGGDARLSGDSVVAASTYGEGRAGAIEVFAGGIVDLGNGSTLSAGSDFRSDDSRLGDAGRIEIEAQSLKMFDSKLMASSGNRANAGTIDVTVRGDIEVAATARGAAAFMAGNVRLDKAPVLDPARVSEEGRSGDIRLNASNIVLDTGAMIDISTGRGNGGSVTLDAESLSLLKGALILAVPSGAGQGGNVTISLTDTLLIEGKYPGDSLPGGIVATSIASASFPESSGPIGGAGSIDIAAERAIVGRGGLVSSGTVSTAPAGDIGLHVGSLEVRDGGVIATLTGGLGAAGDIDIHARERIVVRGVDAQGANKQRSTISTSASFAPGAGQGLGGNIRVAAPLLSIEQGGLITSATGSDAAAGTISLATDRLTIRSGGEVNTETFGAGPGGAIEIGARLISIDGRGTESLPLVQPETGIFSRGRAPGTGNAGAIRIQASEGLDLLGGAQVATSTQAGGDAGGISVTAGTLTIDNASLASRAYASATGFAGNIDVTAGRLDVRNRGQISIASNQTVPAERLAGRGASRIAIAAGTLAMDSAASITAESSGNVPAGSIGIDAVYVTLAGLSRITTESANADGGPIAIDAQSLWLTDSQIVTSVLGAAGNGGDIRIETGLLGMNGGFIQANTAAPGASGGDIFLVAERVSLSHGFVQVGGNERLTFRPGTGLNVIQAAAPNGVPGNIQTTVPQLDVAKGLTALTTPVGDPAALVRDRCLVGSPLAGSSLVERPVAGIPPGPRAPAAVPFAGERLDRLLAGGN